MLIACGGGGSAEDGMLLEGTLVQGAESSHGRLLLRHSAGEHIGEVRVCALGECSVTDDEGQWGFVAPDSYRGGPVSFSFDGHGITATTTVEVPEGTREAVVHFEHSAGSVTVRQLQADGLDLAGGTHEEGAPSDGHAHE